MNTNHPDAESKPQAKPGPAETATSRSGEPLPGPEKRLLDRVRNWVDVFPWLRLVRVCRVAGGPVWVGHTLMVMVVWLVGWSLIGDTSLASIEPTSMRTVASLAVSTTACPSDGVVALPGILIGGGVAGASGWRNWMKILWTILIWLPTSMGLVRVGSLLTGGRDMPSYLGTFRVVFGRLRGALLIVILPSLVASLFWLVAVGLIWVSARLGGAAGGANWISWVTLPIVFPALVVAAVLVLGGRFAVPLALAAWMIESEPDPIDSLSRGYEYTLRRLPQLVLLVVVALLISSVVVLGFVGVSSVGLALADSFGGSHVPAEYSVAILPAVIGVMLLWSMIGGIYLLLRQSAGGQEVEDLAVESDHWKSPKLPSVQTQ